jgi:magnesium transporter
MEDNYILLDQISIKIDDVDKIIFESETKKLHYEILQLKKNILNLRKIIQNHKNIFKKLVSMESSTISKKQLKIYYNSLVEHSKRIWEITENQKEHVDALYQSAESLMNNKISDIMKTLTVFSVIILPLNLLASIFGVNLVNGMPFSARPMSFWLMIITMTICFILTLLIFIRKKWL